MSTPCVCVCLCVCVCVCVCGLSPVDRSLVGAVGVLGEPTAAARALEPGHLSAQERLQRLEESATVSQHHTHAHKHTRTYALTHTYID